MLARAEHIHILTNVAGENTDKQNSHQNVFDSWFKQSSENILFFPAKPQNESQTLQS